MWRGREFSFEAALNSVIQRLESVTGAHIDPSTVSLVDERGVTLTGVVAADCVAFLRCVNGDNSRHSTERIDMLYSSVTSPNGYAVVSRSGRWFRIFRGLKRDLRNGATEFFFKGPDGPALYPESFVHPFRSGAVQAGDFGFIVSYPQKLKDSVWQDLQFICILERTESQCRVVQAHGPDEQWSRGENSFWADAADVIPDFIGRRDPSPPVRRRSVRTDAKRARDDEAGEAIHTRRHRPREAVRRGRRLRPDTRAVRAVRAFAPAEDSSGPASTSSSSL